LEASVFTSEPSTLVADLNKRLTSL
jgi:hypothetical protein